MGGACSIMGKMKGVYRVLVGRPDRKIPFGRPTSRWKIIKMDFQEV
jgi:hypothetical protein